MMEEVPQRTDAPAAPSPEAAPAAAERIPVLRVLGPDGRAVRDTGVDAERARDLYRAMLRARMVEERLRRLTDDGWIGFVPTAFGEEAAVVAATAALGDDTWVFPGARDRAALLTRGVDLGTVADQLFGNAEDVQKGRQMPGFLGARSLRVASPSAPAGTQLTHATGFAWASTIKGSPEVVGAFFSAAEASSHDFHTAVNFAGVQRAPVVFLGRGPAADGAGAGLSLADRGVAYGVSASRADGADALAVFEAVREAARRARGGDGPTLVELAVDPLADGELGTPGDPLTRLRVHLAAQGAWTDDDDRAARERVADELQHALEGAAQKPAPTAATLFEDVYEDRPAHLREQLDELERTGR